MGKQKKYYVVWVGTSPGIYHTWEDCERQVKWYPGAKFKSFPSLEQAKAAFSDGADAGTNRPQVALRQGTYLTVDAAYSHKTKILEWRGVLVEEGTTREVFRSPEYQGGSANVGEFLAIIDGIQYLTKRGLTMSIYSDSRNAQTWIRAKRHSSTVSLSEPLQALLNAANDFLAKGGYQSVASKITLLDWDTKSRGEIPADFNRK